MRRLAGIVLLALLVLLGLLATLPLSERGSRLLLDTVARHTPLEVSYGGGRLFGAFELEHLSIAAGDVTVALRGLRADLNPACLWRSEVCLRRLQVDALEVDVPAGEGDPDPDPGGVQNVPLVFPVRVLAPQVMVAQTAVRWDGGGWTQGPAAFSLQITEGGIYIGGGSIRDARLALASTGEADPDPAPLALPELWLPFELAVDELVLLQAGWDVAGAGGELERVVLAGRWQGTRLELPRLRLEDGAWGEATLEGQLEFAGQWPLAAGLRWVPAAARVPPALDLGALALSASGDLSRLALELRSDGARQLDLRARLDTLDPALPFSAEGRVDWPRALPLADLVTLPDEAPPVTLEAPLTLSADGTLDAQTLRAGLSVTGLGYEALAVSVDAEHRAGTVQLHRLALREADGGSALFASGAVALGQATRASLQVSSPGLVLPAFSEYLFGQVRGELALEAEFADARWAVDLSQLSLEGEVNGLPASADGALALDSARYVAGGDLRFDLNGARGEVRGLPGGQGARLSLDVADLGRWQRDSGGQLAVNAEFAGPDADLRFQGELEDAHWQAWQLRGATVEGRIAPGAPDRFQLGLVASGARHEQLRLQHLALDLEGNGEHRSGRLDIRGDITGELQLAARREGDGWRGSLRPAALQTPLGEWALAEAAGFDWRGDTLSVAAHCWRSGERRLCLEEGDFGASGRVRLALATDLGLLSTFAVAGVELEGDMDGALRATWDSAGNLQLDGELDTGAGLIRQQLAEGQEATWGWDGLSSSVHSTDGGTELAAQLRRGGRTVVDLLAVLPTDRAAPLAGHATVDDLQLAALRSFVPALARLEGTLAGEVELAGTGADPLALGKLRWRQGALAVHSSPTEITALKLDLDLRGDDLALSGDGEMGGGPIQLRGELLARPDWALELTLRGQRNHLVYPPSVEVVVTPDIRVEAGPDRVHLGGTIRVEEGEVAQAELPAGSVDLSRDVVQVDYAGNVIEQSQPFDTSMDVRVVINDAFRVVGSGLDARVGGDLQLQQQPGRPLQLYGNLNVVGGEFRAYGQHLAIKQGRVSFAGVPENPELDLRAQREIPLEQVTAGVRVTGTLEVPQLEIYTDPPMSQPEALSYLVRGRGLDAGGDGTAMALSLGTGIVNRSAVVEELNRLPGLSNVEFGAETVEDDTAATVSGYLGERIYLSYGVGLYEPVNVLTARLYLQTRLWLEVVSRLESSVDLYYSFDID
ncbi:translocation/assembly module TamB domain-containing protein [Parahaliea mediterranea]|uniref:Translocation/assembly module TamB domain-containing protein n=1 Tax=Parahaliea mediterranea TaxID=651086 RepID=A0A939DIU9_9GAMM|nr:translocation/assembly module TamB domain-containing protein [Parahaliea mediterranea]MBN7798641.1 translocation/assembly module TamB domain-containing protein [Parahaliea mediterranea]